MVRTSFSLNGSSTFARKRRTITSTTFVLMGKLISQIWFAISLRDTTSPARRTRWARSKNSLEVEGAASPNHLPYACGCQSPGRGCANAPALVPAGDDGKRNGPGLVLPNKQKAIQNN